VKLREKSSSQNGNLKKKEAS
jgi:hypothetical protein